MGDQRWLQRPIEVAPTSGEGGALRHEHTDVGKELQESGPPKFGARWRSKKKKKERFRMPNCLGENRELGAPVPIYWARCTALFDPGSPGALIGTLGNV